MTIGKAVKAFAVNLGVGYATDIIRGYLNGQLKDIEPSDLYDAILEDQDLWAVTPDDIRQTGRGFKGSFGNLFRKYQDRINIELLLQWMREDHPSLYSTIINTNVTRPGQGLIWFDKQVHNIKQKIIEM